MRCEVCDNTGWVCENHADRPSDCGGDSKRACTCGGAGMPCLVWNLLFLSAKLSDSLVSNGPT